MSNPSLTSCAPSVVCSTQDFHLYTERKQKNTLPLYGNKETMNLNSMIRTNILASPYFKEDLYQMKTFHEVIDEIYYKVRNFQGGWMM